MIFMMTMLTTMLSKIAGAHEMKYHNRALTRPDARQHPSHERRSPYWYDARAGGRGRGRGVGGVAFLGVPSRAVPRWWRGFRRPRVVD